ncbi:hypothetical protein FACS189445_4580 [Spirochaetia bacterium]|nr:hypothetical protein FACS189445_4580 [Spirochaetia bacterium]
MDTMPEVEIWTIARMEEGTAVLLRPLDSEIVVPIFIGESEARAILLGLGSDQRSVDQRSVDQRSLRPLTHDLLLDLIKKDGLALYRAELHDLSDTIFYSRLFLTGREFSEKHPLILDARPSDALALALRCKCPVFIAKKVTDQAGLPVEFFLDAISSEVSQGIGNEGINLSDIIEERSKGTEPELAGFMSRREGLQMELDQAVADEAYERAAEIRDILAVMDRERRNE